MTDLSTMTPAELLRAWAMDEATRRDVRFAARFPHRNFWARRMTRVEIAAATLTSGRKVSPGSRPAVLVRYDSDGPLRRVFLLDSTRIEPEALTEEQVAKMYHAAVAIRAKRRKREREERENQALI